MQERAGQGGRGWSAIVLGFYRLERHLPVCRASERVWAVLSSGSLLSKRINAKANGQCQPPADGDGEGQLGIRAARSSDDSERPIKGTRRGKSERSEAHQVPLEQYGF